MERESGTGKYEALLDRCKGLEPIRTAVAHPCEETALAGAIEAAERGLIVPILVGPAARIREIARKSGVDLGAESVRSRIASCAIGMRLAHARRKPPGAG
jgi:phosphotransacetylase